MIDHLWQSTLCTAVAALVALAIGRGPAQVRYGVWLAASLKFLLPFAALTALGRQFAWRTANVTASAEPLPAALDLFVQPFATVGVTTAAAAAASPASLAAWWWLAVTVWAIGGTAVMVTWLRRWRRVATALAASTPIDAGRELDILRRLERKTSARRPLRLRASDGSLEPGVCGIRRPVLLWPTTITARLTDSQIEGILAHEIAHVRRHDNLTAALHMVVQTLFWFHPLVWWLGTRLVDERERACDQAAIRAGSEPGVYAEGILRTVQFYVESPLACVAGVTGSDLKRRIEDIMQGHTAVSLKPWQKAAVAVVALALVAVPLVRGSLAVTIVAAQAGEPPVLAFESASVKRNNTGEGRVSMRIMPGGVYEALNVTVRSMIQQSNQMQEFQVVGGPDWLATQRIDILAKAPEGAAPELMPRLWTLLQDRFTLKTRRETRETPIYALVLARADRQLGPSIKANPVDCPAPGARPVEPPANAPRAVDPAFIERNLAAAEAARGVGAGAVGRGAIPMQMTMMMQDMRPLGSRTCNGSMNTNGKMIGSAMTMAQLAQLLQRQTGRIVQDRTALAGRYDFDLQFTPDSQLAGRGPGGGLPPNLENPRPVDPNAISIFTAVQEQLGLRLESSRGPVEVLVIDSAEPLVEN